MNSLRKIAELATRFERKLAQSKPQMQMNEGGNPQVIKDAFFASSTSGVTKGKSQEGFTTFIFQPGSNFQNALQHVTGKINVGVTVNAPSGTADFTNVNAAVKDALTKDFTAYYGQSPAQLLSARISAKEVPANVAGTTLGAITA